MLKSKFNCIIALITGLIILTLCLILNKIGQPISLQDSILLSFMSAFICYALMIPTILQKIKHICCDYDWAEVCAKTYNNIPKIYRKSFWIIFALVNLAFLFNTINFMWGNKDWNAVRFAVDEQSALQNGTFSAYWLQELMFDGMILPVINNLLSFAGLSLAAILLAIYWQLEKKVIFLVCIGLLLSVTPYTLVHLYSLKTFLGICWIPTMVLSALILSEKNASDNIKAYIYNIISLLLLLTALGTNIAAINFFGVALLGKVLLKMTLKDENFHDSAICTRQSLANMAAALMIYLFILMVLKEIGSLNQETANLLSLSAPLTKIPLVIKTAFGQLLLPVPFMDIAYKMVYMLLVILAIFTIIFKTKNTRTAAHALILIPIILTVSSLSILLTSNSSDNLLAANFFGLPLFYTLLFVLAVSLKSYYIHRLTYLLTFLVIFMNFVHLSYAQKVWKFGWDAETKLAERIITRLEKMPDFDITRKYKLLQIGDISLRQKYYQKTPNETPSENLLNGAYYLSGAASDAYNFFYQADFLEKDSTDIYEDQEVTRYLLNKARAWPAKESLYIHGQYIVIVLDDNKLAKIRQTLSTNQF